MKRNEQLQINSIVEKHMVAAMDELLMINERSCLHGTRLRACQAYVFETENYYVLRSYNTFVAVIPKSDRHVCFDFLRKVYGYTSTSSQHISKFSKDYGAYCWGCDAIYRWREV